MGLIIELNATVSLALEVMAGQWGNGEERKQKLESAGYDYDRVQKCVNELMALIQRYE